VLKVSAHARLPSSAYEHLFSVSNDGIFSLLNFTQTYDTYAVYIQPFNGKIWMQDTTVHGVTVRFYTDVITKDTPCGFMSALPIDPVPIHFKNDDVLA
jgi:hypothetical protein